MLSARRCRAAVLVATRDWGRVMAEGEQYQHPYRSRMFGDPEIERAARETTFGELRSLPEAELVARYDRLARSDDVGFFLGPDEYLNELTRRETERQGKRLEWLTWALVVLTIVIAVATLVLLWSELRH